MMQSLVDYRPIENGAQFMQLTPGDPFNVFENVYTSSVCF